MPFPTGVTPVYDQVVISVYNFAGTGFGIGGTTPQAKVGTVYNIGSNVYTIGINDMVGFRQTDCYFATSAGDTFAVVDKSNVLITYVDS